MNNLDQKAASLICTHSTIYLIREIWHHCMKHKQELSIIPYLKFMAPRYQIEKTVWIRKSQKKLQLWAICGILGSRNTCHNSFFFCLQGRVRRSTREEQNVDVWSAKKNIQQTEEKFIALFKIFLKINVKHYFTCTLYRFMYAAYIVKTTLCCV